MLRLKLHFERKRLYWTNLPKMVTFGYANRRFFVNCASSIVIKMELYYTNCSTKGETINPAVSP